MDEIEQKILITVTEVMKPYLTNDENRILHSKLIIALNEALVNPKLTYECKVCGKPFGDKLSLYEHYDSTHNQAEW